jgi:hypothetical protein
MFELADTWVESIDGEEYAAFLARIFFAVVDVKVSQSASPPLRRGSVRCVLVSGVCIRVSVGVAYLCLVS